MPKKKPTEETANPTPAADPAQVGPEMVFSKSYPMMSVLVDVTDADGKVIRTESYIVSAQLKMTCPDRAADLPTIGEDVKNFVGSMFAVGSGGPSLSVDARLARVMKVGDTPKTTLSLRAAREQEGSPPSFKKGQSFAPTFAKVPKPKHEPHSKEPK